MFWFFRLAICVRALPYNGRMPQAKGDTQMTRTSYAMPAFDGTAALEQRPHLVLIRGGLSPRREHGRVSGRLTPRQSLAFVALGVIVALALCAVSVATDARVAQARERAISQLPEQELVVRDGDSLWSIASSLGIQDVTASDLVSWISERNGLDDALLSAGQRLVVPAPVSMG